MFVLCILKANRLLRLGCLCASCRGFVRGDRLGSFHGQGYGNRLGCFRRVMLAKRSYSVWVRVFT